MDTSTRCMTEQAGIVCLLSCTDPIAVRFFTVESVVPNAPHPVEGNKYGTTFIRGSQMGSFSEYIV